MARYAIAPLRRCSACGGLGHRAAEDGMCSSSALALDAVLSGATVRDAAGAHGVSVNSVYQGLSVVRRGPSMRERRRVYIEARVTAVRRADEWFSGRVQHRMTATWDWPPEVCDPPPIATAGADHAEIPDPIALLEVGWRTTRPRRP